MTLEEHATADVNLYSGEGAFQRIVQSIATISYRDGTKVELAVPFVSTRQGQTPEAKYQGEYRKVLEALKSSKPLPYGERGWKIPYESGEALIGSETSEAYSAGVGDEERLDIEAFKRALEDVCGDVKRIKVSELYQPEHPVQ
jgi:hypothetical protein